MQKILFQSRTTEVNNAAGQTVNLFNEMKDQIQDENLILMMANLEGLYNKQTQAIKKDIAASEMDTLDEGVNNSVRSLFKMVDAYCYFPDQETAEAAQSINKILNNYGLGIIYENYATQMALVDSMLLDIAKFENTVWDKLPGSFKIVEHIEVAQKAMKSGALKNKIVQQETGSELNASELRKEIMKLINTRICKYVEVMSQIDPTHFKVFAETLEKIISSNNQTVRMRSKSEQPAN